MALEGMAKPQIRVTDSPISAQVASGRRLRAARQALGLTQQEMADVAGLSGANAISQWESGAKRINPFGMAKIKARWGISLDFVYAGDISSLPHKLVAEVQKHLFHTA